MNTSINYSGLNNTDNWLHFSWIITINGVYFDYKTGIGCIETGSIKSRKPSVIAIIPNGDRFNGKLFDKKVRATIPNINDILECLINDSEVSNISFNEFCSNYGYSTDSIKALNIYQECSNTKDKLIKAIGYTGYNDLLYKFESN